MLSSFEPQRHHGLIISWMLLGWVLLTMSHDAVAKDKADEGYRLTVKPSICVSYDLEEPCSMGLLISWEGERDADVCLRESSDSQGYIRCWQNSRQGSVELEFEDTGNIVYQLIEESSQGILADTEVKVINRDLRNSRRRRRHVWSII